LFAGIVHDASRDRGIETTDPPPIVTEFISGDAARWSGASLRTPRAVRCVDLCP